jgi:hypothetical protein
LDTSELEAIAICYDAIRLMRRRLPNNDDAKLGQQFDGALRQMMDQLSADLQKPIPGELKVRASIVAKKELLSLLTDNISEYFSSTDTQGKVVFDDIIT